jgi:hypothetical protein
VFPVDKTRWRETTRYVRTFVPPMTPPQGGVGAAGPRPPPRREAVEGLPAGDYYVVAVDDIISAEARDAAVLEQLSSSSSTVRVTLSHDGPASVSLKRAKFAELVAGR